MEINDHQLINLVQLNPCLYDKKQKNYKNNQQKMQVWETIAKELNSTGTNCAKRFQNLREKFSRELRSQNAASGSGQVLKSSWPYFQEMQFLRGHMALRRPRSNFKIEPMDEIQEYAPLQTTTSMLLEESNECISDFRDMMVPSQTFDVFESNVTMSSSVSSAIASSSLAPKRTPKKRNTDAVEKMVDKFQESATAFNNLCQIKAQTDNVAHGFSLMMEATLAAMSPRKKQRKIQALTQLLFAEEDDPMQYCNN